MYYYCLFLMFAPQNSYHILLILTGKPFYRRVLKYCYYCFAILKYSVIRNKCLYFQSVGVDQGLCRSADDVVLHPRLLSVDDEQIGYILICLSKGESFMHVIPLYCSKKNI